MNILLTEAAAQTSNPTGGIIYMVVWLAIIFGFMYFVMIRPQKKEQKEKAAMMANLEVGDTILTTSGFYGTVIDINDDMVIVEFGNNKNCRIPMQKAAIVAIEKPEDAAKEAVDDKKDSKDKDSKKKEK